MKKFTTLAASAFIAVACQAQTIVRTDSRTTYASDLQLYEQDAGHILIDFMTANRATNVSGTVTLWYSTNGLTGDETHSIVTTVVTPTNRVRMPFTSADFPTSSPPTQVWTYGVTVDDKTWGDGTLFVKDDPFKAGEALDLGTIVYISWSSYTQYYHTAASGPVRADGITITNTVNSDGSLTFYSISVTNGLLAASYTNNFGSAAYTSITNYAPAAANSRVASLNSVTGGVTIIGGGIVAVTSNAAAGTVTVTGTEADTLATVANRGATTTNRLTVGWFTVTPDGSGISVIRASAAAQGLVIDGEGGNNTDDFDSGQLFLEGANGAIPGQAALYAGTGTTGRVVFYTGLTGTERMSIYNNGGVKIHGGNLDMGDNSITNVATNSLTFANGVGFKAIPTAPYTPTNAANVLLLGGSVTPTNRLTIDSSSRLTVNGSVAGAGDATNSTALGNIAAASWATDAEVAAGYIPLSAGRVASLNTLTGAVTIATAGGLRMTTNSATGTLTLTSPSTNDLMPVAFLGYDESGIYQAGVFADTTQDPHTLFWNADNNGTVSLPMYLSPDWGDSSSVIKITPVGTAFRLEAVSTADYTTSRGLIFTNLTWVYAGTVTVSRLIGASASDLASGTLPLARLSNVVTNGGAAALVGTVTVGGTNVVTTTYGAATYQGLDADLTELAINNGSGVTNLSGSNLASGTVPLARLSNVVTNGGAAALVGTVTVGGTNVVTTTYGAATYQGLDADLTKLSINDGGSLTNLSTISSRYIVETDAGKETYIKASGSGITGNWSGTGLTLTIPSGAVLHAVRVNWDAASYGTTFTIDVGTNDMINLGFTTRWPCAVAAYRQDTGAYLATAQGALVVGTHSQMTISGLQSGVGNTVLLEY